MTLSSANNPTSHPQKANPQATAVLNALSEKLKQTLAAQQVEIIDNSWQHAGHVGADPDRVATHLAIQIVSDSFEAMPLIDRHRRLHEVLAPEMSAHIHALELRLFTPAEWEKSKK
ncbi:MAG: BolA family transcriptional regulator [Cyanobacteria bacterium]|nr:BolA family transcriptional regulator [Cyanobacteriota bacterium]